MTHSFPLSAEQQNFISIAQTGKNVLVDACIGSGKTTAIQRLCDDLPKSKRILYLTYNRLLKIDARSRIASANTAVTNYHGFAYGTLKRIGINPGISDLIQAFIEAKPPFPPYDVLIIDEYQDIEQEFADMLEIIKAASPQIQIIAVGDMQQKIYDKTTLNAADFIHRFLGDYERLTFTQCFRLSRDHAAMLGRVWKKPIVGVNQSCIVEEMNLSQAEEFLSEQDPRDILCLGSRNGSLSDTLNELESKYPDRYNKNTVYASISEGDNTKPGPETAIFTTFDSSKGLERKICVVFDFTESYWQVRLRQPQQSYEILRNIFCVAASRGKEHIIFAHSDEALLSEDTLSHNSSDNTLLSDMDIGDMFRFKYREDNEECYERLTVAPITQHDLTVIHTNTSDGLIDLAPCIGLYQKAVFFSGYDIEKDIELKIRINKNKKYLYNRELKNAPLDKKILFSTFLDTNQERYYTQVKTPFVNSVTTRRICARLSTMFVADEQVQQYCQIDFAADKNRSRAFSAIGHADLVRDNTVYALRFTSRLSHEDFLECACYMIGLGVSKGVVWNVRDNAMFSVEIPDRKRYLDAVARAVTKQAIAAYFEPCRSFDERYFAVIDTETNWSDEVMSVGIEIADAKTFRSVYRKYYILTPECRVGGMFSNVMELPLTCDKMVGSRAQVLEDMKKVFERYDIRSLFAYNAKFDQGHLPEINEVDWFDIMQVAAYRQYNPAIPHDAPCYKTGRLKHGCGVQSIYRLLSGNSRYYETHNALTDASDELEIMRMLDQPLEVFKYPKMQTQKHKAKKQPQNMLPDGAKVGARARVKGKGVGVIDEINDRIIKVKLGENLLAFTRKDAFEQGWLKLDK